MSDFPLDFSYNPRDELVGEGTTTLDYLYHIHPWLKVHIEEKDKEIKKLRSEAWQIRNAIEYRTLQGTTEEKELIELKVRVYDAEKMLSHWFEEHRKGNIKRAELEQQLNDFSEVLYENKRLPAPELHQDAAFLAHLLEHYESLESRVRDLEVNEMPIYCEEVKSK